MTQRALPPAQLSNSSGRPCYSLANGVCAPLPACELNERRVHTWSALKKLADNECALAKSIRRQGSEWEFPRSMCGQIAAPSRANRTVTHAGSGAATRVNRLNVTKRFVATSSRWWGALRLHGGMCGREHYLLERAALCRLERVAAPCGPAGRAHFFPRLLAWNDDKLRLVVTYEGSGLLKTTDVGLAFATVPVDLGRNLGRYHNCTSRRLACASSPPTAGTFAEQDKCITSQLQRANVTHGDRACANYFISDDGSMTLGDFELATVDGIPALNAYGHRVQLETTDVHAANLASPAEKKDMWTRASTPLAEKLQRLDAWLASLSTK